MKAILAAALLVIALPAAAQDARPLPPDSFQWDGLRRPGLRDFSPPTPPTITPPPQTGLMTLPATPLPPGSFRYDALPPRRDLTAPPGAIPADPVPPALKPEAKPGVG